MIAASLVVANDDQEVERAMFGPVGPPSVGTSTTTQQQERSHGSSPTDPGDVGRYAFVHFLFIEKGWTERVIVELKQREVHLITVESKECWKHEMNSVINIE